MTPENIQSGFQTKIVESLSLNYICLLIFKEKVLICEYYIGNKIKRINPQYNNGVM